MEAFLALEEKYFNMKRVATRLEFRKQDDLKQAAKGQPSLDKEEDNNGWANNGIFETVFISNTCTFQDFKTKTVCSNMKAKC